MCNMESLCVLEREGELSVGEGWRGRENGVWENFDPINLKEIAFVMGVDVGIEGGKGVRWEGF